MDQAMKTAADVRKFNRFYLPFFHLLSRKYLNSDYSAAEARILYEIYDYGEISARDIVNRIHVDKGYLSRILKKFETKGVVCRKDSQEDSRLSLISLTEEGKALSERLIEESTLQVIQELEGVSAEDLDKLSYHMEEIIRILKGERSEHN